MEIENKEKCCKGSICPSCSCCICICIEDLKKILSPEAKKMLINELQREEKI